MKSKFITDLVLPRSQIEELAEITSERGDLVFRFPGVGEVSIPRTAVVDMLSRPAAPSFAVGLRDCVRGPGLSGAMVRITEGEFRFRLYGEEVPK